MKPGDRVKIHYQYTTSKEGIYWGQQPGTNYFCVEPIVIDGGHSGCRCPKHLASVLGIPDGKLILWLASDEFGPVGGASTAHNDGCICKRCNSRNEFAAPNQPDGAYVCFNCRE